MDYERTRKNIRNGILGGLAAVVLGGCTQISKDDIEYGIGKAFGTLEDLKFNKFSDNELNKFVDHYSDHRGVTPARELKNGSTVILVDLEFGFNAKTGVQGLDSYINRLNLAKLSQRKENIDSSTNFIQMYLLDKGQEGPIRKTIGYVSVENGYNVNCKLTEHNGKKTNLIFCYDRKMLSGENGGDPSEVSSSSSSSSSSGGSGQSGRGGGSGTKSN